MSTRFHIHLSRHYVVQCRRVTSVLDPFDSTENPSLDRSFPDVLSPHSTHTPQCHSHLDNSLQDVPSHCIGDTASSDSSSPCEPIPYLDPPPQPQHRDFRDFHSLPVGPFGVSSSPHLQAGPINPRIRSFVFATLS